MCSTFFSHYFIFFTTSFHNKSTPFDSISFKALLLSSKSIPLIPFRITLVLKSSFIESRTLNLTQYSVANPTKSIDATLFVFK